MIRLQLHTTLILFRMPFVRFHIFHIFLINNNISFSFNKTDCLVSPTPFNGNSYVFGALGSTHNVIQQLIYIYIYVCVCVCVCVCLRVVHKVLVGKPDSKRPLGRHVARMEEGRGVHKVLVGKPKGKRPLGRPRCRWKDNIKMDLQEVGRDCSWM